MTTFLMTQLNSEFESEKQKTTEQLIRASGDDDRLEDV